MLNSVCLSFISTLCSLFHNHLHTACRRWNMQSSCVASGKTCAIAPFSAFESSVRNTRGPVSPRPPKASFFNKDFSSSNPSLIVFSFSDWVITIPIGRPPAQVCVRRRNTLQSSRSMLPDESIKHISPLLERLCVRFINGEQMATSGVPAEDILSLPQVSLQAAL